ncbi:hypothetical protein KI387_009370, partial [Taxus chinensis]
WKALVENESNSMLKCLRSENGGEYYSNAFNYYCSINGIHREMKVPRKPQENGLIERMNKTIMEPARNMRIYVGFPLQFWTEVVDMMVYFINHGPSSALNGEIP